MNYNGNRAENIKIAYIGGGSRGWAWNLMSDLAQEQSLSGTVYLYDIDAQAAQHNALIGNRIGRERPGADNFSYLAVQEIGQALTGADFVVISILPGTFDEMESDVHTPEKYGIYQSVGDTTGPGGIIRALRTLPMFEEFALAIRRFCPQAWVINYTNPMTMCVRMLYRTFPQIKAFGCCHEVFGTQKLLARVVREALHLSQQVQRADIRVNVTGINHFTWLTEAHYRNIDVFPLYREFCLRHREEGVGKKTDDNWINKYFGSQEKVKMDLFLRYGYIAAAGDRHLAEFCPGTWYLKDPAQVASWGFGLTPVSFRKEDLKERLKKSAELVSGARKFQPEPSGEEGVLQMKALLGLGDLVTNVNLPNVGQIPNLPLGAVVETNARFTSGSVTPVMAGEMPDAILGLTAQTVANQEMVVRAAAERDLSLAFPAFVKDALNTISLADSEALFDEMVQNTKAYLTDYQAPRSSAQTVEKVILKL